MDRRSDRRTFTRVPLEVEVQVSVDGEQLPSISSRDISEDGMMLDFIGVPTDRTLQLSFVVAEEDAEAAPPPFVLEGEVKWRQQSAIGVRFSNLSVEERARLRNLLEQRAQA